MGARWGMLAAAVVVATGCGGAKERPAPKPRPAAAVLPQPSERCGTPDTRARTVRFRTRDGILLDGAVVGAGRLGVALVHEYPGPMCGWWPYANYLADHGMRALLFDVRCLGLSKCGKTGRRGAVADVQAAMAELRRDGSPRVAVVGASFGGSIAVVAGAALDPAAVVDLSGETTLRGLVPGYDDVDALAAARRLRSPALFAVARGDQYTSVSGMRAVYRAAGTRDKRLEVLGAESGHGWDMLLGGNAGWSPLAARVAGFLRRAAA